ncbi:putative ankyrin repeat protein [Trichoderma barbatum]
MADDELAKPPTDEEIGNKEIVDPETLTDDLLSLNGDDWSPDYGAAQRRPGLNVIRGWGWSGSSHNDFDVVTVHGIRDDYKTAWTKEDETWWVKDGLFTGKSIRELDYAYDIDEEATIYNLDGIQLHAETLITAYAQNRSNLEETEIDRPIIWICHDLGGTIVKEALRLALNKSRKYRDVALLTTGIIFLGTPHRFHSIQDAEDQLYDLLQLPGPEIRTGLWSKVRSLAFHVNKSNESFLATKILDRVTIFNLYVQHWRRSMRQRREGGDLGIPEDVEQQGVPDPITPFSRYTHMIGHAFEASGMRRIDYIDHNDIVRGDDQDTWLDSFAKKFDQVGYIINVNRQLLRLQANILSLAPPTICLDTPFDTTHPVPPIVQWIEEQKLYADFVKSSPGFRFVHLFANEASVVDIKEVSRLLYVQGSRNVWVPYRCNIFFEFNQWDARYNTMASMLTHIINTIISHFWDGFTRDLLSEEVKFLSDTHAWSLEDLFYLYRLLRLHMLDTHQLTIFISCFDQCPEDQRRWFLKHMLERYSHSDEKYRLIISTSTRDGLGIQQFPDAININVDDCPSTSNLNNKYAQELMSRMNRLLIKRPIYEDFQQPLKALLEECESAPYLGHIILNWLKGFSRGWPKSDIGSKINDLLPVTAENTTRVIISSLSPERKTRAEKIFNWVKHAIEPWTLESLSEALAVDEFYDKEPCFSDIDTQALAAEISQAFCGIVLIKNRDVKFSHGSFYLVSEMGFAGSSEYRAARVNSSITDICLRYLQLPSVHKSLAEFSSGILDGNDGERPLDAVVICRPRVSLAEYAVQFWPHHYKASGAYKPRRPVLELFANKEARRHWETLFWLLSNPFTRPQRSYISDLPIYAMLGLEYFVDEKLKLEIEQPFFHKDCWFAVGEAARAGHGAIVDKLLPLLPVDEEELHNALSWGAGQGNPDILKGLVKHIPDLKVFPWPKLLFHRAASIGMNDILIAMLQSGYDINTLSSLYNSPAINIAALRCCVSSAKVLLASDPKPDLTIKDDYAGDNAVTMAVSTGDPEMLKIILEAGGSKDEVAQWGQTLVQLAVTNFRHEALRLLLKAGADFTSGEIDDTADTSKKQPLILAAIRGATECARALLNYEADPIIWGSSINIALYEAAGAGHTEIARLLLEHDTKQDLNARLPGRKTLLMQAIDTEDVELVSMLIKRGAEVNILDQNVTNYWKTPLSLACLKGLLDMVKLLMENGADVNFTGDVSDPPFMAAIASGVFKVATHLLQDERVVVDQMTSDGVNALIVAFSSPSMVQRLLERGLPINHNSFEGTILLKAATNNCPKTIQVLLKHDPKPDLECICQDNFLDGRVVGCTALQAACYLCSPKCVKILLDAGASVSFRNKKGKDALDLLLQTDQSSKQVEECFKLLLSHRKRGNAEYVNERRQTRLHFVKKTTKVSIVELLVAAMVPFDTQDEDGYTPLAVAVREGNRSVAEYLIEHGANVNIFGPKFGSILHIAVTKGNLSVAKILVDAGADREAVDPKYKYGESLLYAAFDIEDDSNLKRMVKYLVDDAKVPINKYGGAFGYALIRAATVLRVNPSVGDNILRFLLRRKAEINVIDNQGCTALHLACTTPYMDRIKSLVKAGANVDTKDKYGRLPIHFAAGRYSADNFVYLLDQRKDIDVDAADQDGWTPLLWAARSGAAETITKLVGQGADIWARGRANGAGGEWSALRLMNFSDNHTELRDELKPKELVRTTSEGTEEWNSGFHKIKPGDAKPAQCGSCRVTVIGIQWKCVDCSDTFSLCFKCFSHRSDMHDSTHTFQDIEPFYREAESEGDENAAAEAENSDGENVSSEDFDLDGDY